MTSENFYFYLYYFGSQLFDFASKLADLGVMLLRMTVRALWTSSEVVLLSFQVTFLQHDFVIQALAALQFPRAAQTGNMLQKTRERESNSFGSKLLHQGVDLQALLHSCFDDKKKFG